MLRLASSNAVLPASALQQHTIVCATRSCHRSLQCVRAVSAASDLASASESSSNNSEPAGLVDLPPPTNVRVKTAKYISSAVSIAQCPPAKLPEFAVIGRSNVGKSSLINMLTNNSKLAMVSKTPGKTKCINHFLINDSWYLVDMPGYGYAKVAKTLRIDWNEFTKEYFLERETLANVLLLVDASIPPQRVDVDCANWLGDAQVPFSIVFTKCDKRKKKCPKPSENMEAFKQELQADWATLPVCLPTSSTSGEGRQELLHYIAQLRDFFIQSS